MSDISWPCRLDVCSLADIKRLPRNGPQDLYPRRKKSKDYVKNIYKLADGVEQKPWFMRKAAKALRDWVNEKHTRPDLLDVSYILDCLKLQQPPAMQNPMDFFVDQQAGRRAVGLEPMMAQMTVSQAGRKNRDGTDDHPSPSMEAEFVYSVAAELVTQHNFSWPNAIALGEQSWARFPKPQKNAVKKAVKNDVLEPHQEDELQMPVRDL